MTEHDPTALLAQEDDDGPDDGFSHATLKERLVALLDADPRVGLVVALGSSADGAENALSDIDICVVMHDDRGLNELLRELTTLLPKLGKVAGYYQYNPYHFYVVYEGAIPLDLYLVSTSLYYCLRGDRRKTLVDHAPKDIAAFPAERRELVVRELLLKAWIRIHRLLSKLVKDDHVTLLYILAQIREEQLVPLLALIGGYRIAHIKAVKLDAFALEDRELFVATYGAPDRASCLTAIQAAATLTRRMHDRAAATYTLGDQLDSLATVAYGRISATS